MPHQNHIEIPLSGEYVDAFATLGISPVDGVFQNQGSPVLMVFGGDKPDPNQKDRGHWLEPYETSPVVSGEPVVWIGAARENTSSSISFTEVA